MGSTNTETHSSYILSVVHTPPTMSAPSSTVCASWRFAQRLAGRSFEDNVVPCQPCGWTKAVVIDPIVVDNLPSRL